MAADLNRKNILVTSCGCHLYMKGVQYKGKYQIVTSARLKIKGEQKCAHRVAWEIANKRKVPKGKLILHSCDAGNCVNPKHLRVGTYKDNAEDRDNRGRHGPVSDSFRFSRKGKVMSSEHKEKIRATLWGNTRGSNTKGIKHSEQSRKNMSIGQQQRRRRERRL